MNVLVRIIIKIFLTIIIFLFFGGVFRGCSSAAQTNFGRGFGLLFSTVVLCVALYGVWTYSPSRKSLNENTTLKKD